ncbi:MAG TPA: GGDEF domain-containing protein [Nitrospira sp.]|jgi:diguanylate cyclase (GGDEF)-like protein|nr:GGDEF domain-containing protein [Nitrospira sp.]
MTRGLVRALLTFFFPGGLFFLAALGFLRPQGLPPWCQTPVAALPYLALTFGLVFGWYFANTRMLLSLLTLTFAHQTLSAWPLDKDPASLSHTVFAASAFLIPLNFLTLSLLKDEAIGSLWGIVQMFTFLLQPFAVWWLCDPAHSDIAMALKTAYLPGWSTAWTLVPQPALLVFIVASGLLLIRFALRRHPMDAGAAWALAAVFLAYHGTQLAWSPTNFFSTAGLIVFLSLIQAIYQETYRDELTGIPGRMAYEEATAQLGKHYALGVLAIDQLKAYSGAHGKSVAEQILKLVAPKVQAACQAGRAFRVSGEELTLLFPHQSALEALVELENIRKRIESTSLALHDGRRIWEGARGTPGTGRKDEYLPITASIGVADTLAEKATRSMVIKAAYRALYEAKAGGGNVVKRGVVSSLSLRRSYGHSLAS